MPKIPRDREEKATRDKFHAICEAIHREAMDELIGYGFIEPDEPRRLPIAVFNKANLTIELITHDGHQLYEIDLERCTTPAQLLDWIYQLHGKTWMTPDLMGKFLSAIQDACREVLGKSVQGCFCPFGQSKTVDWKETP